MPVRKRTKNRLSLTGAFYSRKLNRLVDWQSASERDLLLLCEFDPRVRLYEEQPLKITYLAEDGRARRYTPDALVEFVEPAPGSADLHPRLIEAKTIGELRKKGREFAARFRAARRHAKAEGWKFHLVFDRDLRVPLVANIRFLSRYWQPHPRDPEVLGAIRDAARSGRASTVAELLELVRDVGDQAVLTDALWHLVALQEVFVDLEPPLTQASRLLGDEGRVRCQRAIAEHLRFVPRRGHARVADAAPPAATPIRYEAPDLLLSVGAQASRGGEVVTIVQAVDLATVLVRTANGTITTASVSDLQPPPEAAAPVRAELTSVSEAAWQRAVARYHAISPLLAQPTRDASAVQKIAESAGVSAATVYRWRALAQRAGVTGLIDRPHTGGKNQFRVDAATDAIIVSTLSEQFVGKRAVSVPAIIQSIQRLCREAEVPIPHANTIRNRIGALRHSTVDVSTPQPDPTSVPGAFPHATTALSVVQIDHARADVMLVDDHHRRSIGRPWVTVAIDVATRIILGLLIALDPPSTLSVGLCLHHVLFPKERWLAGLGLFDVTWPCYGVPGALHADNAREFRGTMLLQAATLHGIRLEFRPVKAPQYGAHIERMMGNVQQQMKLLPGATESDVVRRGTADPAASAVMTLNEYTTHLVRWIAGQYHHQKHAGLDGQTPMQAWTRALTPSADGPGAGLPPRLANPERVLLDFLPLESRLVRKDGIHFDNLRYFDPCLRQFQSPKYTRDLFTFRVDPRDLGCIYLLDPRTQEYWPIPLADRSRPRISQFELREATKALANTSNSVINEDELFRHIERNRQLVEDASEKTAKARRTRQRRRAHDASQRSATAPHQAVPNPGHEPTTEAPNAQPHMIEKVRPLVADDETLEYL